MYVNACMANPVCHKGHSLKCIPTNSEWECPPLSQERLKKLSDGRLVCHLKRGLVHFLVYFLVHYLSTPALDDVSEGLEGAVVWK